MSVRGQACDDASVTTIDAAPPRYRRAQEDKLLAGVAAGLAHHLRVDVIVVRLTFVVLGAVGGFGLLVYAALWVVVPQDRVETVTAPGLAAAERLGLRPTRRIRLAVEDAGQLLAFAVLALGLAALFQSTSLGVNPVIFWPSVIVAVGVFLIWRQSDESDASPASSVSAGGTGTVGLGVGWRSGGWRHRLRVAIGAGLVVAGLFAFVAASGRLDVAGDVVVGAATAVVGVLLIGGPWLLRIVRDLRDERTERALSQQQADVAAHLHDSVLQTLALIQRQASDPREVVRLARSQERDLRGWLYGVPASPDSSLRIAIERVAAEVEEQHGVLIEVVVVGDCPVDPAVHALVRAAREALVNAATHAQMDRVDVFAEVEGNEVTAFVRDRGVGFDPDAIADGRMGVRGSIIERMQRHGGTATVRSTPGGGTEVRLTIKVAPEVHRAGSRQ
ncbi:MAG: PspC domain-containing protein [Sporichthyaceae bacterium]|nr:PspC domain-containing protein [Sporichthyaceae bacterium]